MGEGASSCMVSFMIGDTSSSSSSRSLRGNRLVWMRLIVDAEFLYLAFINPFLGGDWEEMLESLQGI